MLAILTLLLNLAFAIDYCKLCENGTHTMCQFKEKPAESCINYTKITLTSGDKMYILDVHNDIRNHVASGQESRGVLGNQPAAADMFLLEWDEELANIAQRWVDQCIPVNVSVQHDKCKRTENFEVGQNIVTAITTDAQLPELSVMILNWYKQIMYVIPSDVDEFIGPWRGKHQIGQYTQLVWAKTKFVGCAVAAFKETVNDSQYNIRFICNYGPAGNIIGQPVYQRGKPCSKCPHRVCDRVRSNLCGGIDKTVDITKQKNIIFKKFKDKATTMSNIIDIEDPKANTKFFHFTILNTSKKIEFSVNTPNITDAELINMNATSTTKVFLIVKNNVSSTKLKKSTVPNCTTVSTTNKNFSYSPAYMVTTKTEILNNATGITEKQNYFKKSNYTGTASTEWIHLNEYNFSITHANIGIDYSRNSVDSDTSTTASNHEVLYNEHRTLPDLTLSTKWREKYHRKNLKLNVTFVSTIQLIIDNFFNESVNHEAKKKPVADKSVIDLTKNKCEKKVKLNNGIILAQDCEGGPKYSGYSGRRFSNRFNKNVKTITVTGNEVILPGNRHFKRVKGIWSNRHCKCTQFLRSSAIISDLTQTLFLLISIVYFV